MDLHDGIFSRELLNMINRNNAEFKFKNNRNKIEELMKNLLFPKVRVYCYEGPFGVRSFEEESDLKDYMMRHGDRTGRVYAVEYLGDAFDSKDVIRIINLDGSFKICTRIIEESCMVLNIDQYVKDGSLVWGVEFGSLRNEVMALRNHGVSFSSDVFSERGDLFARFKDFANDRNGLKRRYVPGDSEKK